MRLGLQWWILGGAVVAASALGLMRDSGNNATPLGATESAAAVKQAPAAQAPAAHTPAAQAQKVDSEIPKYQKVTGISGNVNSIGSDTLNNLMTFWAESFKGQYPSVRIQIEGKGSNTAPPAITEGTSQLGPMSRTMKDAEIDAFEKKHSYKPTAIRVAIDGLAVYVNKDNPLDKITMPQLDAIFSKGRKGREGRHHDLGDSWDRPATGPPSPSASTAATPRRAHTTISRSTRSTKVITKIR